MEIISYGGGVQTAALTILNVMGKVEPRAEAAVTFDEEVAYIGVRASVSLPEGPERAA